LAQSLFISLFSNIIVDVMYGQSYQKAVPILWIIVWYSTFSYIGAVRAVWILAEKKQKYLWIISFTGMILNVVLNFVLIPIWGAIGAAFATLITQIFSNYVNNYFIKSFKETNVLLIKGLNLVLFFKRK
jgi:O-antigen/teichoic acid export membrane protein